MINVIKASGEKEAFSEEKLRNSIRRAGINDSIEDKVVLHINDRFYDNIPTSEIYRHISEFFDAEKPYAKTKYGLKQAIMELGPTGYPFEDYVADVLQTLGYQTSVRNILQGTCVTHEVDILAEKNGRKIMVEAKFHNASGTRTDLHVSLYTKARFDDSKEKNSLDEAWIVTNTKATTDAISYAFCSNMKVISWSYPDNEGLRDLVENAKLYPITMITNLSQGQKQMLLENHIVLCRKVNENPHSLDILHIQEDKKQKILEEITSIYSYA